MNQPLRIGIVGDFDLWYPSHIATNEALHHAASVIARNVDVAWLPTPSLENEGCDAILEQCDALWCAGQSIPQYARGAAGNSAGSWKPE